MFIISLTYKVALNDVEKHIDAHIAYIESYYEKDVFLASGRKVPRTGGIILAQANDKHSLEKIVQEDPFVIHDIATYDITEVLISKTIDSLASLKADTQSV